MGEGLCDRYRIYMSVGFRALKSRLLIEGGGC